jgi:hypothetical protein
MFLLAQIDPTFIETLPDNLKSWGTILLLALLVGQKLFPQFFPSVPVVNPGPVPPLVPVPPPSPPVVVTPPVVVAPADRPVVDMLLRLLPYLPLLLAKEAEEKAKAMAAEAAAK